MWQRSADLRCEVKFHHHRLQRPTTTVRIITQLCDHRHVVLKMPRPTVTKLKRIEASFAIPTLTVVILDHLEPHVLSNFFPFLMAPLSLTVHVSASFAGSLFWLCLKATSKQFSHHCNLFLRVSDFILFS
ncbi:hypothetical protein M951_chr3168 (nucleomorph) [Lotharella oceanica]|uniref:Uncharacterized protein n=1 Tax=Lotharella oceanica TaxID=641309 RepID=A0A060DC47_9EUKA|nr:hypothetical protein M951_chr137 [Lotharella oceanica]AIB09673.1 hypothetical protein M951_chr1194 [Lotharella oceanica]AIB09740.1 hypothetical protein M951_chr237 [Lotharella oceanica]AIB09876.1 hypothetical protein M951_chr2184 [Lotharella oceanica]AIB09943.1 hypothetical protein M951_chr337 [Lotharella oceanica]